MSNTFFDTYFICNKVLQRKNAVRDSIIFDMVQVGRLELPQVTLYAPQTYASTNFAIPAMRFIIIKKFRIFNYRLFRLFNKG